QRHRQQALLQIDQDEGGVLRVKLGHGRFLRGCSWSRAAVGPARTIGAVAVRCYMRVTSHFEDI
ncbi:MAG TPA: hypothetical protein VM659_20575, partial [Dongiaceae bacterium]|nr:hypothetical protein [Dongiaceae bacterium]